MKRLCVLGGLMVLSRVQAQESMPAFQRVSGLPHSVVMRRIAIDDQRNLVVALASGQPCDAAPRPCWWSTKDRLGVLLQELRDPDKVSPIFIEPGPNNDCSTRVERFTLQELVLSCVGEKWITYDNQKFVYDVVARKLERHFSYPAFSTERLLSGPNGPQFVMTDKQRKLLVAIDAATGEPGVIPVAQIPEPAADSEAGFGPGNRFRLAKEKNKYGSEYPVIADGSKVYRLPQTDLKTWQQLRPDDTKGYLHLDQAEMNEEIGPHQMEGGRLWFGKTFYNSEGATGVGGFGYFDPASASYHLIDAPAMYGWSVSAMLVEADAIWMALFRRGEYGDYPGGLVRWDRRAASMQHWDMPWIATSMARAGEAIFMGATDGIVAFRGERFTSYFVDRSAAGRYLLVARN